MSLASGFFSKIRPTWRQSAQQPYNGGTIKGRYAERTTVNICILAAGAGGMYCGSCMRDNALAQALMRAGHQVTLVPLYTPLKTEPQSASIDRVFYGGINVYLQHASRLFRKTPRLIDWLLDRQWLLKLAGKYGASTPPERLGGLTLSILRGEDGPAVKELRRLATFLKQDVSPQVVTLPNLMFVGVARMLQEELGVPIICELTGEDIFLDALVRRDREEAQRLIREQARYVDRFVATTHYYAQQMAAYLAIDAGEISVVYPGVPASYLHSPVHGEKRPRTVGYLARICPEKGLHRLIDSMLLMQKMPALDDVQFRVAGYVGRDQERWYREQQERVAKAGLSPRVHFAGEVDRDAKLALLDQSDLLCVPTQYPEAKGIYVLEAMARGVPVVQPAHGSFPELIERTGGGVLTAPGDAAELAHALADLLANPARRAELGARGKQAVKEEFLEEHMAQGMLDIYQELAAGAPAIASV